MLIGEFEHLQDGVDRRGRVRVFANGDMHYTYRHCSAPDDIIFTEALFQGSPGDPVVRGQALTIYCTGLGAVTGASSATQTPVSVLLNGSVLQPGFAGLTAGFVGLYQVDVVSPPATPPGIDVPLLLRQAVGDSNTVFVAIQ